MIKVFDILNVCVNVLAYDQVGVAWVLCVSPWLICCRWTCPRYLRPPGCHREVPAYSGLAHTGRMLSWQSPDTWPRLQIFLFKRGGSLQRNRNILLTWTRTGDLEIYNFQRLDSPTPCHLTQYCHPIPNDTNEKTNKHGPCFLKYI